VNRKREKPSFKKKRSVRELLRSVGLVAHKHEGAAAVSAGRDVLDVQSCCHAACESHWCRGLGAPRDLSVCMSERTSDAELRFLVPSIIHPSWERHLLP
jgi:hypothetical protein